MHNLYNKSITCPVCGKKFVTKKVKISRIAVVKRDTDFKTEYKNADPTFYGVIVCPKCGHARFESDFFDVNNRDKMIILKEISSRWKPQDYTGKRTIIDAITVHKLAIINYNVTNYKKSAIAKACLRISWYYRDIHNGDDMYLKNAAKLFEEAYQSEDFSGDLEEELKVLYLLGELNRRLGEHKNAIDWFYLGLKNPARNKSKLLNQYLTDQLQTAKDEYKHRRKDE